MADLRVAGIDPSIVAFGATLRAGGRILETEFCETRPVRDRRTSEDDAERYYLLGSSMRTILAWKPDLIGVECWVGWARDAKAMKALAGALACVTSALGVARYPTSKIILVTPAQAKEALGVGAKEKDKELMVSAACRALPSWSKHRGSSAKQDERWALSDSLAVGLAAEAAFNEEE